MVCRPLAEEEVVEEEEEGNLLDQCRSETMNSRSYCRLHALAAEGAEEPENAKRMLKVQGEEEVRCVSIRYRLKKAEEEVSEE